ncbi:nucleoside phosphorylase domain-containing protein [Trichoderma velutinum]
MAEAEELTYDSYTVGLVCMLISEFCAARALLDEEHEPLPSKDNDGNGYLLGKMAKHNVVIVFPENYGMNTVVQTVTNTIHTFPNIRFGLMVGVGGGVPKSPNSDPRKDIRLGDVVVSLPMNGHGGVLQYNAFRTEVEFTCNFLIKSRLNKPPQVLLQALKRLQLDHSFGKGTMWTDLDQVINLDVPALEDAGYPGQEHDQLFKSDYQHSAGENCSSCDANRIENRGVRKSTRSVVHYGLIASGNMVMSSSLGRDALQKLWGVSCFDSEAVGLMDTFPCLIIRGICDYSDTHRNIIWRQYAAIAAAACAKDLLRVIHPKEVEITPLPNITEPPKAGQANGDTQATGNGNGGRSHLGAGELRADNETLRAETDRLRAEAENLRAEADRLRAENENLRAEAESLRAESWKWSAGQTQGVLPTLRVVSILPQGYFQNGGYYPGEENYLVVCWQSGNTNDVWAIHDDKGPLPFIYPAPAGCQNTQPLAFSGRLFCPRAPHISFNISRLL